MVCCVLIYCSCLVCFIVELLFIAVSLCCFCFLVLLFSFVFVFPDCVTVVVVVVVGFWFVVSLLLSMFYLFSVFLLLPVSMVSCYGCRLACRVVLGGFGVLLSSLLLLKFGLLCYRWY